MRNGSGCSKWTGDQTSKRCRITITALTAAGNNRAIAALQRQVRAVIAVATKITAAAVTHQKDSMLIRRFVDARAEIAVQITAAATINSSGLMTEARCRMRRGTKMSAIRRAAAAKIASPPKTSSLGGRKASWVLETSSEMR